MPWDLKGETGGVAQDSAPVIRRWRAKRRDKGQREVIQYCPEEVGGRWCGWRAGGLNVRQQGSSSSPES